MLCLLVHSNLYIAIYVNGVNSWIVWWIPVPALRGTCVQELGAVAASTGRSRPTIGTICGIDSETIYDLFFQMTVSFNFREQDADSLLEPAVPDSISTRRVTFYTLLEFMCRLGIVSCT